MSTLSIPIPDDDLQFLRAWAEAQGLTAEAFLARQAHLLRERLQKPLHPDVIAVSGIIKDNGDAKNEYLDHMGRKHS